MEGIHTPADNLAGLLLGKAQFLANAADISRRQTAIDLGHKVKEEGIRSFFSFDGEEELLLSAVFFEIDDLLLRR